MNGGKGGRLALILAWPVLLLLLDVVLRWRVIIGFIGWEWLYYAASVMLSLVVYGALVWALRRLRQRSARWLYGAALGLTGAMHLAILGVSYGVFFANGDLPDLFLLSFIRCEPANAIIMARDSMRWYYLIVLPLGLVLMCGVFHYLWQNAKLAGKVPGLASVAAAAVGYLSLWYCWSGTASHGQCFVPLIRTPAILAMYAYNEVKGINPLPIEMRPRTPLPVTCRIPQPKVNVLVILNESLRRQSLQLFGHSRETTPQMAAFAKEQPENFFQFDQAYTNSTTTFLSVPSILTGISPLQPVPSRSAAPLLWQWAKAADMHSFYFTSHDLAWCKMRAFLTTPPPDVIWDKELNGHPPYRDLGIDDHFTVDAAVRQLESLRDSPRPFLGVVHLNTNHYPYNTRAQYQRWQGTNLDLYDNTVLETDTHVGRLIDTLRDLGKLDNTVILFASDHGEAFNEHGYIAHFYCHFIETIAVPLWLYLPPTLVAQRDMSALKHNLTETVQNLDILPTLLDCIGAWDSPATEPLRRPLLGQSLLRPLTAERTVWITNTDEIMNSIIGLSSVTGSKHYMIRTSGIPAKEDLYDPAEDPAERNNLWSRCTDAERDRYRNGFLQFPVAARMMREALRQAAPAAPPPPR
jgi:glucan phosphoethanolaminetransferase (alkaline phosphatase superfamily)